MNLPSQAPAEYGLHAAEQTGLSAAVVLPSPPPADTERNRAEAHKPGEAAARRADSTESEPERNSPRGGHDTLAASVILLMILSCVQPLVAFARGVIFCRWLDPDQLGTWDMAFSFLTLAAPLVVFGIPGSFGRYVQHYLQRNQLSGFLRGTTAATAVLALLAVGGVLLLPETAARIMFGDASLARLVPLTAVCLASIIGFGFVIELLTAMRLFRVASLMQFVKGTAFALLGGLLLWQWRVGPESVILAYAGACLLVVLLGGVRLAAALRRLPPEQAPLPGRRLWAKLLPFAVWIWVTNVIDNLYLIADRTMILHYSGLSSAAALEELGHYHSARIVPMLFVSFCGMLAALILPHLSHDWEVGRRRRVAEQLMLTVKLTSLALAAGSLAVLAAGPWLFQVGFGGKYDGGLVVLPWTLAFCAWFGISMVAEMYLWCAERVKLCTIAIVAGLAVNVGLNLVLLPPYGLLGAVVATALSRLVVLGIVLLLAEQTGLPRSAALWLFCLVPACVLLGPIAGSLVLAAVPAASVMTHRLLSLREKAILLRTGRRLRAAVQARF